MWQAIAIALSIILFLLQKKRSDAKDTKFEEGVAEGKDLSGDVHDLLDDLDRKLPQKPPSP